MKTIVLCLAAVGTALMLGVSEPALAEEWSLNDSTSFNWFDFHFFRRYEESQFTLRGIGEHCYVWTQNNQWAKGRTAMHIETDTTYCTGDTTIVQDTVYVRAGADTIVIIESDTTFCYSGVGSRVIAQDTTYVWRQYIVDSDSVRIDDVDINAIIEAFDVTTPAADAASTDPVLTDTRGVYDKLTDLYGPPPDIDGDPKVHILIMDCTEDIGYAAMQGYFDPVNQLTKIENRYSNQMECFYIDCVSYDPGEVMGGLQSLAQQFTHMIQYKTNPDAKCWITDGLANFSQFICGYGVLNDQVYSRNFLLLYLQSYLTNCREQPEAQDQAKTSMFMQYIYEKYGIEVIQTLAADTEHSGPDDSGAEAVTAALAAHGYSAVAFDSLFYDEQLAWFMDDPAFANGSPFFGGKYSFKYYTSGPMLDAKTFTYWCNLDYPPYPYIGNQWSMDWILANPPAPCLGDTIVFKGDVDHEFRVTVLKANLGWNQTFDADSFVSMEPVVLDDKNRGLIDVSGYGDEYSMVYTSIMHKGAKDGGLSSRPYFVMHNDLTPPDTLHVAVIQNALASKFLNIYVAGNESLFVDSYLDQRPLLQVVKGSGSTAVVDTVLEVERFLTVTGDESSRWDNTIVYLKQYSLTSEGDFRVVVQGWDMAGNEAPSDEISGVVKIVGANRGATLASQDGKASLAIPAGAVTKETYVTLFPVSSLPPGMEGSSKAGVLLDPGMSSRKSGEIFVGPGFQFGPAGQNLFREARLTFRYADSDVAGMDESQLSICRLEGQEWVPVESERNTRLNEISAAVDRLGQYRIVSGGEGSGTPVPETFALQQNYPNPFNPTTDIRYQIPMTESRAHTTLKIYNILGQEVRTLVDEIRQPGYYSVTWDGQDDKGQRAASGIYFYRIVAGQYEGTRRMVLVK